MEAPEVKTVRVNPDAREEAHVRSFTKWINGKLSKTIPKIEVTDLYNDLRNGQILLSLLQVLIHNKLPREKGKLRIHHASNVDTVLKTLSKEKIVLHGISTEAIIDGVPKSTLGLVWSIILHYQVHGSMKFEPIPSPNQTDKKEKKPVPKKVDDSGVEQKVLRWVQGVTEGYDDIVEVKDLSKSWRNGLAFNALIHVHRNDLIDLEKVEQMSNKDRLNNAFNVAEKDLNVHKLLEPSDVDQANPDKKLIMMYVSSLSEALRPYQPVKRTKRRKVVEEITEFVAISNVESSIPEPSQPFLEFKDWLVESSTLLQKSENDYVMIEKIFQSKIDLKSWEEFEKQLQLLKVNISQLEEKCKSSTNDPRILPSEVEKIQSDFKAVQTRWKTFVTKTEVVRNRIAQFETREDKELEQWKKQTGIYFEWVNQMNKNFDLIEAMKSQDNLNILGEQAKELKRLGQALNEDPFPQKNMELGNSLLKRNVLGSENQAKVQDQLLAMEKEYNSLKSRAAKDIDKLNNNIDAVKSVQADQMGKWRKQAEAMCDWLDAMEDKLERLDGDDDNKDIKILSKKLEECESLQEILKSDEKPHLIMEYGESLSTENSLSKDQKAKIEEQLKQMNNEWRSLMARAAQIKARLIKERETRELEEKHKVEEWIRKFEILLKQLKKIKENIAESTQQSDFNKKEKIFQECVQSVENIRPEYKNAVECAENVLTNDACPEWEKSQVKEDVSMLKTAWKSVLDDISEEKKSIGDVHAKATNDQLEKIQEWRQKYIEVQKWYETISTKIEGDFTIGKTLPAVRKQVAEQEALLNEMVTTHETVEYLLSGGQELLQNKNTPEAEKNKLRKDIANLVERWESLSDPVNNRMQRLTDMAKHLQDYLNGKVHEWTNLATAVENWLTKSEKKFQAMGGIAPNLEAAIKQKPRAEALAKEVKQEEKKLSSAARVGEEILTGGSLSEEDNNKLQQELTTLNNRWQALDEKTTWRVKRLDETISRLGSQQDDKLAKWRENAKQISDWLDKAQLRLAERGPIGSDLKSVTSQKESFQVFVAESLLFQNNIYEFTEFGENLRTDPCINEEERVKVQHKTKALNDRWDGIVQQINNHDNALEQRMDELEENHQNERLEAWKNKSEPLQKWLTAKAIETKSQKEIGLDLLTIQKQIKETKTLKSRVDNYGKHFRECISLAEDIQKDSLIEDDKAQSIQDLAHDLTNRWSALKYALDGRIEKLSKKETEFLKEKSNKVSEWQNSALSWKEWLKKKQKELDSQGAVASEPNLIKIQKPALQSLSEEVKKEYTNWDVVMALADDVLAMKSISDDDRRQIQQERFGIKNQWDALTDNIDWKMKRLDNKEKEFINDRTAKTKEWKNKAIPLQDWLKKKEAKVDTIQTIPDDFESVTVQINEIQMLVVDIDQKEKQLNIIYRLGEDMLQSPSLSDEDRTKLNDDIVTLKQSWKGLSEKIHSSEKSLLAKKSELLEQKQVKLGDWEGNARPLEQWLTEEENKFDGQAMSPGVNLGFVKKKREEAEEKLNALLANEKRLNDVEELYEEMQSNPSLSVEDKRKLLQEMNKIRTSWKKFEEKIETAVKRFSNKESDLRKERESRVTEWQTKRQELEEWINGREEKVKNSDEPPQGLDIVRKQIKETKEILEEFHSEQKDFRILTRVGEEAQGHPSLFEEDRETVRNELTQIKLRWKMLEEKINENFKSLTVEEEKLLEIRANDLAEWKETVNPVKDWISKQEKKIQLHAVTKHDHDSVAKQRQEVEVMSEESKKKQESLTNLDSLYEKLREKPSLSEEDKKKLRQDYNLIKNNWSNLEESINQTHERLSKQQGSFKEERVVKMEEWRCKSAPLEQLFSEQGTKWEDDNELDSSDLETVRKQKQVTHADVQTIQKQQVELENAIRLGEEVQKHTSLRDEDRSKVRMQMSSLKSQWQSLEERMHKKKKRLSFREVALAEERSNLLGNLKKEMSDLNEWFAKQEKKFDSHGEVKPDLDALQKLKVTLEAQLQEVKSKYNHLENVVDRASNAQAHGSLSDDDKKIIKQDVTMLENNFKTLTTKIEERIQRVCANEKDIEGQKDSKLIEWQEKLTSVESWLALENEKMEKEKNDVGTLDLVTKQKREMEDIAKDMELQERKQLTGVIRFGEELKTHVSLSNDDRRKIQEDIETLNSDWENLREKMDWKIKRISEKEMELREQASEKLREWKNTASPLQEWLSNEEQNTQESLATDTISLKRQTEECLTFRKDLELQRKRVENVASFGAEIAKHPSLSEENRKNIEQCIVTIRNDWERLDEKTKWRLASAEKKQKDLDNVRDVKMQEWRAKLEALQSILEEQENTFKVREGIATDLETVKYKKSEVEDMLKELELEQKKELDSIIHFGLDVSNDPSMSQDDNRKIKQDISNVTKNFENLEEKMRWRAKRLSEKEKELERFRAGKLSEWKTAANNIQGSLKNLETKLELSEDLPNDLDELRLQKTETESLLQEMEVEKNQVDIVVQMGDQLLEHPSLFEEDRKHVENQLESIQNNWHLLFSSINKRMERIVTKEAELDIEVTKISMEWRNQIGPLREWINESGKIIGEDSGIEIDLDYIRKQKTETEAVTNDMHEKEDELRNVIHYGYKVQENPLLSQTLKENIQKESTSLKQKWDSFEVALEEKTKSVNKNLRNWEKEQTAKLSVWRETCKPLSDWLDNADHVLSSSDVTGLNTQNTKEHQKKVQTLLEESPTIEPKFSSLNETAATFQQEPCLSQQDRNNIQDEAERLSKQFLSVVDRLSNSSEQLTTKYRDDQLTKWNNVSAPVTQWISSQDQKLESLQEVAEDLSSVQKQQEETEAFLSDVASYKIQVEAIVSLNSELSEDPLVNEETTDVVAMQTKNIKNRWRNLNEKIQARSESLSMRFTKLLNERQRRLSDWNDKVSPISEWVTEKQPLLASLETQSPDIDTARNEKNQIVDLVIDLETHKESLDEIFLVDFDSLNHPSIPEEERDNLKQHFTNLQNNVHDLTEKAESRSKRLKETVRILQSDQKTKLKVWQEKMKEVTDALESAEKTVTKESLVGANIETVKAQKENLQNVLEQCLEFQKNIYEFTNLSENLRTDPCISGEEKLNIATTTEALNKRWDLVVAQLRTRNKALERQLDELEEKHIAELMTRWKAKYEPLSQWLNNTENEIKSLNEIGDNAVVVQAQQKETQIFMSKLTDQEATYKEVISLAETINNDPLIEDNEAETINKLATSLTNRWEIVNDTINTRSQSLLVRESFLSEHEQHLLHEWRRSVEPFNNWLSKVEEDGSDGFHGNIGVNTIKDYSVRCKTLEREVEGRKPVLEEIERLGKKLLEDSTVRGEEKVHIKEEMEILLERWKKLHVTIHDNTKWADIKLIELAKKEQETLDVWKKNVEPFNTWLDETDGHLKEIESTTMETDNLKAKHLALQKIKEDVNSHEEALTRIVTIAGKLTEDENISEVEKNNIKAEMNRLQDKWNSAQNDINLNYLTVTESLMELAQKEKATLEEWKKQTDPFKEWVVEAKGRIDNALHPGEGFDVVFEQKGKLETLSQELEERRQDHQDIVVLKNTIVEEENISNSFKNYIERDGDCLDQKWNELGDLVSSKTDRAQKRMVSLEGSQRTKLEKWQNDFKNLNNQQNETEDELQTFETIALDIDQAKKQLSDLKVVEQKIEVTRLRVEEVSPFCTEISSDLNISKTEKTRVKKEMDMIKDKQSRQTKTTTDYQRRLEAKIRDLQDSQTAKLEKWQTSSQPLHEWLDGMEDDAKEYDIIEGTIGEAQIRFDELQKLTKEFKETEADLFNVLKLGEELSADPQVSQEVRESVADDVATLRQNHDNVSELIKSQREKMKSQLLKLQQHQERCLIDWNQRKNSINARVKAMEKRTLHSDPVGNTSEEVQEQKYEVKAIAKELESIEYEVATVLEYGETLCKDKSIVNDEKGAIQEEMKSIETSLNRSLENVEKRKSALNAKMESLRKARANEFLSTWKKHYLTVIKWLSACEDVIKDPMDNDVSLSDVREHLDELDEISEKLEAFEPEFLSAVKSGEDVVKEPSVEAFEKETVEKQLSEMKEKWHTINDTLDSLTTRLEDEETSLSKQHQQDSEKWHEDWKETKNWCKETKDRLDSLKNNQDLSNYDRILADRNELQIIVEKLPKYEVKIEELNKTGEQLSRDSKKKNESEKFKQENRELQNDFNDVKKTIETLKENYDSTVTNLENEHGQKLSEWTRKGERVNEKLLCIEHDWQQYRYLENESEEEIKSQRSQLEAIVSDLNDLQPDYERHISFGRQLATDPAISSDTRAKIQENLDDYEARWKTLQIAKRLLSKLPRLAVVENIVKVEDEKQVESVNDTLDDLFGIDHTDGPGSDEVLKWHVDFENVLKWCVDAEDKIKSLNVPVEYIVLVERQHSEIEEMIQAFTSYEDTITKMLENGDHMLSEAESLRLSTNERTRLENDIAVLKMKWSELQENAFATERRLNEHLNKLREFEDWKDKANALSQWLDVTDRKLDCCDEPSEDLEERKKQKLFLQKFALEKQQNEESINDVLTLGRYIVSNHLVLKEKYNEVTADVKTFKDIWNNMLAKADKFCKSFGVEFSHINVESSDNPFEQWKKKVKEVEKWIEDSNEKISLNKIIKDYYVLNQLPEDAKEISEGIDGYCVVQLNEITSKGQDLLNSKNYSPIQTAEITDTIGKLGEKIDAMRLFVETQRVHVRNTTLEYFTEKLNGTEAMVEKIMEDMKQLKTVGTEAGAVKKQVDFVKNWEEKLEKQLEEFEETKKQILEMEEKEYLSSEGFEGTLKVKTTELEPKLDDCAKQFMETKTRLSKGVVNFHGQHKDVVKKWLKNCEKQLNEVDINKKDVNALYEEYSKIRQLRCEMIEGEQDFLTTLELNERLIAEEMLNEKQGREYQVEVMSVAKWRNQLQRQMQEKDASLYIALVDGLDTKLTNSINSFEEAETRLSQEELSADFDTATEQMDGAKHIVEDIEKLKKETQGILDLSQDLISMGNLILKEKENGLVKEKLNKLKKYHNVLPGKSRDEFNRLYDDYLTMFRKEIMERKNWIAVSENRISSNFLEIENLDGFVEELNNHKEFENELNNRDMRKMSDAAERVSELQNEHKIEVRNLTKRWLVLKHWCEDYSLELQRIVKEWRLIENEKTMLTDWLDPHEETLLKLNEKIKCNDSEGIKQEINDLKQKQLELEERSSSVSQLHQKGMDLMKFLNDQSAGSRTIHQELAELDKRWNIMAKKHLGRIELLRNVDQKQDEIAEQKEIVNVYIDNTNAELDDHEMKNQRLRGNVSEETITENGETVREKKIRMRREKESDQQDIIKLVKSLGQKITDFPRYQVRVDRINSFGKDVEDVADEDSKTSLNEELATFNARWQVIVTRLEDYSDSELPQKPPTNCSIS